jgi:cation transporter-like permease
MKRRCQHLEARQHRERGSYSVVQLGMRLVTALLLHQQLNFCSAWPLKQRRLLYTAAHQFLPTLLPPVKKARQQQQRRLVVQSRNIAAVGSRCCPWLLHAAKHSWNSDGESSEIDNDDRDEGRHSMGRIVQSLVSHNNHKNGAAKHGTTDASSLEVGSVAATASTKTTVVEHDERTVIARFQRENELLKDKVKDLEAENQMLHYEVANRIVLETFEGEGKMRRFAKLQQQQQQHLQHDAETTNRGDTNYINHTSSTMWTRKDITTTLESSIEQQQQQPMAVDPSIWCDQLDDNDSCPLEPMVSFGEALRDRALWLVGLLILQSCSGIILARNEELLTNHPVSKYCTRSSVAVRVVDVASRDRLSAATGFVYSTLCSKMLPSPPVIYYLTMLVGAGGNAGNQASVRVIRGLALGTLSEQTQSQFLMRELKMAGALSAILSLAGFVRAAAFRTPFADTIAVTAALTLIVFTSVCLGAILPLILKRLRIDPAHSSTTIQVIMDILGVVLAVSRSSLLLDSPLGSLLISKLLG